MKFTHEFIEEFTNNLGKLWGPQCEIVIHDFTNDLEHTIVHIVNGDNSGRKVGDSPTNLFFEHFSSIREKKESFSEYYTTTEDGRTIRSSTTFLEDENKNIIGAICINFDITNFLAFNNTLGPIIGSQYNNVGNEKFAKNVQELMDYYLDEVEEKLGKTASQMGKNEKLQALAYLDEKGITQISKAHVRLCEFFNISKFTLYNYLDEVRKNHPQKE